MEEGTRAYQGPVPAHRFSGILQAMTPPIWLDEHGQEVIPWPQADGAVRLIPVEGEAG